jgi:hypothetical protein
MDFLLQLEGMGFNRELVLEVFFACNKDEELAANYLGHGMSSTSSSNRS